MMSEKRFICGLGFPINSDDPIRIISDSVEDKDYYRFSDICNILNKQQITIERLKKDNEKLQQLVDVSMKADEVFSVFDDLKYIESALTFLIDNGLEDQCVECEREDIHFVAERLKIVLRGLDDE